MTKTTRTAPRTLSIATLANATGGAYELPLTINSSTSALLSNALEPIAETLNSTIDNLK